MNTPPAQPVKGLIDGLTVLQALAVAGGPVSGAHLARMLGFERTRVNRILKTLASQGIAYQTPDRKYTSGAGMHVLAAQSLFGSGLIQRALPCLETMGGRTYVVALGVLWNNTVSYLYHRLPGMDHYEALGRLGLYPATESSIGMALLAEKPDKAIKTLYAGHDIPGYRNDIHRLLDDIRLIRQQGYSHVAIHDHSIAVAVGSPAYAAIALSGCKKESGIQNIVSELRANAAAIASRMTDTTESRK